MQSIEDVNMSMTKTLMVNCMFGKILKPTAPAHHNCQSSQVSSMVAFHQNHHPTKCTCHTKRKSMPKRKAKAQCKCHKMFVKPNLG